MKRSERWRLWRRRRRSEHLHHKCRLRKRRNNIIRATECAQRGRFCDCDRPWRRGGGGRISDRSTLHVRSFISLSQEYSADNAHAYKEGQTADFRKEEPSRSTPISTCIGVTENISKEKISNQSEI